MERVPVKSSNVKSLGYDDATATMEVEFHAGDDAEPRVYRYTPIARAFYDALFDGESIGHRIHAMIRERSATVERVHPAPSLAATRGEAHDRTDSVQR